MNGMVIPGTPIAVDFWKLSRAPEARLFFLTHLHADHIQGLTSSWRHPIYTSPTNAALLSLKYKFPENVVQQLEIGETYQIPLDTADEHILSVTVLDANHVPGAVMFLFQGYFGNYLYCGDMRWYPELLDNPVLKSVVELHELDCMYLDNTFSAPYCKFPNREEAKKLVFSIVDQYPDSEIKIGIRSLGKESLLEAVAQRYQERILVTQEKYEILQVLKSFDVFTTDPNQARIHALPINQITLKSHEKWNEITPTVSIILTALFVGWPHGPYSSSWTKGLHVVPYSDHSSYSELMEMVASLAPKQVLPIVKHWSKAGWWSDPTAPDQCVKSDMSVYDDLLTTPPPDCFFIPKSVEDTMKTSSIFHRPEVRHCGLRRGLMSRPKRARTIPRGVIFTPQESLIMSPTPTASTTLDLTMTSPSSTPSHTYPWKTYEECMDTSKHYNFNDNQIQKHFCDEISATSSPLDITHTYTTPYKSFDYKTRIKTDSFPSCRDCSTQTPRPNFAEVFNVEPEDNICNPEEVQALPSDITHTSCVGKVDPALEQLRHESVLATREMISEVVLECKKSDGNLDKLLKKTEALCNVVKMTQSLF